MIHDGCPCDSNREWVYNFHNRKVLPSELRLDRCSSLVARECRDLGEHLHERHFLPEGYRLAESTPVLSTAPGKSDRILWADSETGENTLAAVQNHGTSTTSRTRMFWMDEPLDFGERAFPAPEPKKEYILTEKAAEFLMGYPRLCYTRILKADVPSLMAKWVDKEKDMGSYTFRKILRDAACELASDANFSSGIENAGDEASRLFEASLKGSEDKVYGMVREAVETEDTIVPSYNRSKTASYLTAKKVEELWSSYWETTEYFKGSKYRDRMSV